MAEENIRVTGVTRVLIILYALAIVIIGGYPMRKDIGNLRENLRKRAQTTVGGRSSLFGWMPQERTTKKQTAEIKVSGPGVPLKKTTKDLDELTARDREELGGLINKLTR